jgi:hypothetical protein
VITSDELSRYRLAVLYGLDVMDDVTLKVLRVYVMHGGHVIAIGPTACADADGKPHPADQVDGLFGPADATGDWDTVETRLADGRATSFPTIDADAMAEREHVGVELLREVDAMSGARLLAHDCPHALLTNVVRQPAPSRLVIHLVNQAPDPLAPVRVAVAADKLDLAGAAIHSPDPTQPTLTDLTPVKGGGHFQVRGLDLYAVVELPLKS